MATQTLAGKSEKLRPFVIPLSTIDEIDELLIQVRGLVRCLGVTATHAGDSIIDDTFSAATWAIIDMIDRVIAITGRRQEPQGEASS